jgi:ABC-type microcin C transport system permease subunit YejB
LEVQLRELQTDAGRLHQWSPVRFACSSKFVSVSRLREIRSQIFRLTTALEPIDLAFLGSMTILTRAKGAFSE